MNHRLVLCCALVFALASIPARVTADSATGNSEYNKVCPNPEPVEHELAPGYKPTYYCDTLPPMSAVPVWTAQTITDCALTCNAPDCRGASWERSQGVCWRYVRNPSEGDGNVWITTSGAFAGQHSCPEPQECACSAEELRICNEKLQKCETSPTDCSSCPSQDCTPILKELNEWKIADGTCESSPVDFFLFSFFTSLPELPTT